MSPERAERERERVVVTSLLRHEVGRARVPLLSCCCCVVVVMSGTRVVHFEAAGVTQASQMVEEREQRVLPSRM